MDAWGEATGLEYGDWCLTVDGCLGNPVSFIPLAKDDCVLTDIPALRCGGEAGGLGGCCLLRRAGLESNIGEW